MNLRRKAFLLILGCSALAIAAGLIAWFGSNGVIQLCTASFVFVVVLSSQPSRSSELQEQRHYVDAHVEAEWHWAIGGLFIFAKTLFNDESIGSKLCLLEGMCLMIGSISPALRLVQMSTKGRAP